MDAFRSLTLLFCNFQSVLYVDTLDDEHAILRFFNFSANFACELAVGFNLARLQRAPKGSKQSTRD